MLFAMHVAFSGASLSAISAACTSNENNTCTALLQTRTKSASISNLDTATAGFQGCTECCNDGTDIVPCFNVEECAAGGPVKGRYAFVFTYTGKPPPNFLPYIENAANQTDGASTFDLILVMPKEDAKQLDMTQIQRMSAYKVQLREVDWAVPPMMKFTRKENWCGLQDFVRLHVLGLEGYDAVAYYDTDVQFQGDVTPVLRCAARDRFFLTTNGGIREPLNVGFFAVKPSSALLQAALAFAKEADYDDLSGWGQSDRSPNAGYYVGGECGQGFFHHLFYKQGMKASQSAFAEARIAPGSLLARQIDRCTWNYQTSLDCTGFDCSRVRAHHKPTTPLGDPEECLKLGQK